MEYACAYAPGHLTGLFQICDQAADPLVKGARGSGVSIDIGVYTCVRAKAATRTSWTIQINGKPTADAFVSENVLCKFQKYLVKPLLISVEHYVETPMIAGFGSSGGGALSLSLALNNVAETGLTRLEAAHIAHIAEIECKTGLGSVFAAERGGFGILTKPGAPGIGLAINYPNSRDLRVVYMHLGSIHTKEALSDPLLRTKINELGGSFVDSLQLEATPERFMSLSRKFTEHVGLATPRLKKLLTEMDVAGYQFTMAMFGEVAFSVMEKRKAYEAATTLEAASPGYEAVMVGIDNNGARIID